MDEKGEKKEERKKASTCCEPNCGPDTCPPSGKKTDGLSNRQQKGGGTLAGGKIKAVA